MALTAEERRILTETHDGVVTLNEALRGCKNDVGEHHKVLYGNGWPGLVSRVAVLWYGAIGIAALASVVAAVYAAVR